MLRLTAALKLESIMLTGNYHPDDEEAALMKGLVADRKGSLLPLVFLLAARDDANEVEQLLQFSKYGE